MSKRKSATAPRAGRDPEREPLFKSWTGRRSPGPAIPIAHEGIRSTGVADPGAPIGERWYHGTLLHHTAENRIRMVDPSPVTGTYLVYDAGGGKHTGRYCLAIYKERTDSVLRLDIIRRRDGNYVLGRDCQGAIAHDSIRKLVRYHRGFCGTPIPLETGELIKLSKSYVIDPDFPNECCTCMW